MHTRLLRTVSLLLALSCCISAADAPKPMSDLQRSQALDILKQVSDEIKKHYYDPKLHNSDFDKRLAAAPAQIKQAKTFSDCFAVIASVVDALDDSHTIFIPPTRPYRVENGWEAQYIGDRYFVTSVKPGSDAEQKGLHEGDEIVGIEGFKPDRAVEWKMYYYFNALSPRSGFRLMVRGPGEEQPHALSVMSKVVQVQRVTDLTLHGEGIWDLIRESEHYEERDKARWKQRGPVVVIKMPTFVISRDEADAMEGAMRKGENVVLDLRGNGGGLVSILNELLGSVFEHDVKIADRISRKPEKPDMAKGHGGNAYTGKLNVLVDSKSASAAEIFSRVVQLEKRGQVFGDRSSGFVMQAKYNPMRLGADTIIPFGVEVTDADLVMADGKSLEKRGVIPDKLMLPTAEDLAAGRDPVLAAAIQDAGGKITPEEAGKMFPRIWLMK